MFSINFSTKVDMWNTKKICNVYYLDTHSVHKNFIPAASHFHQQFAGMVKHVCCWALSEFYRAIAGLTPADDEAEGSAQVCSGEPDDDTALSTDELVVWVTTDDEYVKCR